MKPKKFSALRSSIRGYFPSCKESMCNPRCKECIKVEENKECEYYYLKDTEC